MLWYVRFRYIHILYHTMSPSRKKRIANTIYLLFASLAVGWMVGSSISPVVQVVVSSLIAILVTIAALASGLSEKADETAGSRDYIKRIANINLFPVAVLCVALAIGAASGIFIRTHNYLGVKYAITDSARAEKGALPLNPASVPGLYSVEADQYAHIKSCYGKDLERALRNFGDKQTVSLVDKCNSDSLCLEIIKEIVWAKQE